MSSSHDERIEEVLSTPTSKASWPTKGRMKHPKGWEPGLDTEKGTIVAQTDSEEEEPDWTNVVASFGLDPEEWTVYGDRVHIRVWDVPGHGKQYYHKADFERRSDSDALDLDIEALADEVRRRGPLKAATERVQVTQGGWLVVVLSDWQAGKGTGQGIEQLIERVDRLGAQVEQRIGMLRSAGVDLRGLCILIGGDMVENCAGNYEAQPFETVLTLRDQMKAVRRLLLGLLDRWAPLFDRVTVVGCAGNHGEKRKDGKIYTTWSDNYDLEVVEIVDDMMRLNPERYGHVETILPDRDRLTATVDLDGVIVGVAHGHQFGHAQNTQRKALEWWKKQAFSKHPVGEADVLVSGHYHHFEMYADGVHGEGPPRLWMCAPAMDGGSPWWEHVGGAATFAGTLSFVVAHEQVSMIEVLPADGWKRDAQEAAA